MENSYFSIANKDLRVAKIMMDEALYNDALRYCQQFVEKSLKGVIETRGETTDITLLSVHNVINLFARFCDIIGESVSREDKTWMIKLKSYYFDTNYPGESFMIATKEDVEECYEYVLDFKKRYESYFATS